MSERIFWAAWHPQHGFDVPYSDLGATAFVSLDWCAAFVKELNEYDGSNNRNGWRATKVKIERVTE